MKVLHVCNHFSPCMGGVERIVSDIAELQSAKGHEVKVVCLNKCAYSHETLKEKEKFGKIRIERLPFLDLKYYKITFGVLGKVKGFDVVHVHGVGFFSDFLIATKFLHHVPVVVSTHGGIFHTHSIGLLKKIYFHIFQRALLNLADAVIAVSKNDLERFLRICSKTVLVENGVDVSKFSAGKKKPGSFLFVGRFSQNKRIDLLLKAFSEARKRGQEFSLFIAGTDWEGLLGNYLKAAPKPGEAGKIKFILNPSKSELEALYRGCEFFVSASEYEGFGISLVEAMASGCIPIVQKNDGFSNIVDDGKNGFFADYSSSGKAAARIISALEMNSAGRKKIAASAAQKANDFSWDGKIEKLEHIYRKAMK